jgi:hypothetical protein
LNGGEAIAENAGLGLALIEQRHAGKDRQVTTTNTSKAIKNGMG